MAARFGQDKLMGFRIQALRLVDEAGLSVPFHIEVSSGTVSRALEMVSGRPQRDVGACDGAPASWSASALWRFRVRTRK